MRPIDYAVPIIPRETYAGSYRRIPVDATDPRYHEPLVPLDDFGVAYDCYYARTDGNNPPYGRPIPGARPDAWARRSVAEKLARANAELRPHGVELLVWDAYRPVACQQGMFDAHYAAARAQFPDAGPQRWHELAKGRASPTEDFDPTDSTTWLPHLSGAALDLTLRSLDTGEPVNMGSHFEELIDQSEAHYFEVQLEQGLVGPHDPRLNHRRLLHRAMSRQGFQNDPFVYWHFDWGNQLYVKVRRALAADAPTAAWYGYVEPPPLGS